MNVTATDKPQEISLNNCDKEPVHIPGHIQGFAICLATDENLEKIQHCSDNVTTVFGATSAEILGNNLSDIFDKHIIHDLNNALSLSSARVQRERASTYVVGDIEYEVWVHYSNAFPVIELEPVDPKSISQSDAIRTVRSLLAHLGKTADLQDTFDYAVDGLRNLTAFDRVMLYQFDDNGNGDIKAEAKSPGQESFLGLRFPSWDIPKQAREILKKLPLRLIADVNGKPVPLSSVSAGSEPLDLTLAACRGQSPIHSEYLRNMGVSSTMTLSIVIGDKLWGLFAFHNMSPRVVSPSLRASAELFVQFFCMQLEQRFEKKRNLIRSTTHVYEKTLFAESNKAGSVVEMVDVVANSLCQLIEADGLSIMSSGQISQHGVTPGKIESRDIANRLFSDPHQTIVHTDYIGEFVDNALPCAGALAIRVGPNEQDKLVFFREEAIISVNWAGAPEKTVVEDKDGPRLLPRGSFKAYAESVKGKSQPWEQDSLTAASELREVLTDAEFERLRRRQRTIYINELNHRVRNILALIRSLVRRTKESSTSLESYAKSLEQRIIALGVAHDLAANRISTGIEIRKVFETEAQPFISKNVQQIDITGERYTVKASVAPLFALITHELTTNCVKYGALSVPNGHVKIDIKKNNDGVVIVWQESNGPAVKPPKHKGFGLSLIEASIPYELDGKSQIEFLPQGLRATFELPNNIIDAIDAIDAIDDEEISSISKPADDLGGIPKTALVLEDSLMIAMDMADMLEHLGMREVQKCSTVNSALEFLKSSSPDFAILDINLRDEPSFEVAEVLHQRSIPFCFATGYGSNHTAPQIFSHVKVLTKPVDIDLLSEVIREKNKNG